MSITVNLNSSQFFIAIAKKQAHSFIMLGTYENNTVQHLLCRVGKVFDLKNRREACSIFGALAGAAASSTASKVQDEGLTRKNSKWKAITYQAYTISFKQYKGFIQLLESLQTRTNTFDCYKPVKRQNKLVTLEKTADNVCQARPLSAHLHTALNRLSIDNTCRHGAIKLVEATLHQPISSLVSTNFFNELPYKTFLEKGVPNKDLPFYVLPPPPNTYSSLSKNKMQVLVSLYNRMEKMLLIEPYSESTQNKFQCLKDFYEQQVGNKVQEPCIERLLFDIKQWKDEHATLLNNLRKTYFFDSFMTRKSATWMMIEELEHDLQQKKTSC